MFQFQPRYRRRQASSMCVIAHQMLFFGGGRRIDKIPACGKRTGLKFPLWTPFAALSSWPGSINNWGHGYKNSVSALFLLARLSASYRIWPTCERRAYSRNKRAGQIVELRRRENSALFTYLLSSYASEYHHLLPTNPPTSSSVQGFDRR